MITALKTALLIAVLVPWPGPESGIWDEPEITDYPAVMSLYDPALGGWNCGHGCDTIATGQLEDWMYEQVGACDQSLLGAWIEFPSIDFTMYCGDTGPAIRPQWSDHHNEVVLYFDVLWHLPDEDGDGRVDRNEDGGIDGIPYWTFWTVDEWHVHWSEP